jgi:hypothetical protein
MAGALYRSAAQNDVLLSSCEFIHKFWEQQCTAQVLAFSADDDFQEPAAYLSRPGLVLSLNPVEAWWASAYNEKQDVPSNLTEVRS